MPFMCQTDSYLKEFKSFVKSCEPAMISKNVIKLPESCEIDSKDDKNVHGFDVILDDTIFFPEGGGQPYDTGDLSGFNVINVRRKGNEAILFVLPKDQNKPFEIGDEVLQKIDWHRRHDHMQQHSAQHLITAIANYEFQMPTTAWNLGEETSFIEMDTPEIVEDTFQALESRVNQKIREHIPVEVTLRERDDLKDVRFHLEVPEDWTGPVRIVSIEGIDKNTCCGTHVSNLGELQAIKFIGAQKGKKGKTQLHFLAGKRVFQYFDRSLKREKALSQALKCPNEEMLLMVEKLQQNIRRLQKNCTSAIRDLGKLEAEKCLESLSKGYPLFYSCHRTEGDPDFITFFIKQIKTLEPNTLILLSITEDCLSKTSGAKFTLYGDGSLVSKAANIAITEFDCKGVINQNRFQGRMNLASKMINLEKKIKDSLFLKE